MLLITTPFKYGLSRPKFSWRGLSQNGLLLSLEAGDGS